MFNPLHSSTNQELFEKHLCNQNSHYENMDSFCFKGKPSYATAKSTLFTIGKDEWDTKEGTAWLVHEECIVCTAVCQAPLGPK